MLWKEFAEQEDCDGCPLLENEICPGGWTCYGGEPIEPPCCFFDDDTDLDEWVNDYFEQQKRREKREEERIRAEKKKKERAQKAADTRRALLWYCRDERRALKRAENALKSQQAAERFASSLAEALNITNEMFQIQDRVKVKSDVSVEVRRLEEAVFAAKEKYEAKRKEFYSKRKEPALERKKEEQHDA